MKKRYLVLIFGVLLAFIIGLIFSFQSLIGYYKESAFESLKKQSRLIGRNVEGQVFEFEENLKYAITTGRLERFLSSDGVGFDVIDSVKRFYSKHQDLIASVEINDPYNNRIMSRGKDNYFQVSDLQKNAEIRPLILHPQIMADDTGFFYVSPIYSSSGDVVADIRVALDLPRFLKQHLLNYYVGKDSWTWCMDAKGRILTVLYSGGRNRSLEGFRSVRGDVIREDVARQLEGTAEHSVEAAGNVPVLSAYYPISIFGKDLGIVLSISQEVLFEVVRSRIVVIGLLFLGITLWVTLVLSFIVYRIKIGEEALRHAKDQAEKALAVKDEFTSTVSHELRTPLAAMKSSIDILASEVPGKLSEDQKTFMKRVKSNIDRLGRLINEVLDLSKLESGRMAINRMPLRIEALIQEVVEAQSSFVISKGLFIGMKIAPELPSVLADRDLLTQVLNNLISNALKFTREGSVTVEAFLEDKKNMTICIRDTGIGVKPEEMEKLFEKFYQVGGASQQVSGTGLGLPICKEIVQRHGGQIWVESEFGKGSAFFFTIPVKQDKRILVVDDDRATVEVVRNILKGTDMYEIDVAFDGFVAGQKYLEFDPHLIILDIGLPKMGGLDVCSRIKHDPKTMHTKIIMVSSFTEDAEKKALEAGADAVLNKPVRPAELLSKVGDLV